jgi:DNA-binding response OmpR family regulator
MDILCIEPDVFVRDMIVDMLRDAGLKALGAPDAARARSVIMLDGAPRGVVVGSLIMVGATDPLVTEKEADILALLREITASHDPPGIVFAPVVTGTPPQDMQTRTAVIRKPFDADALVDAVRSVID